MFALGFLLLVVVLSPSPVESFMSGVVSFRVLARSEECVYNDVKRGEDKVFVHYTVTEGGSLDIDMAITGPDGVEVFRAERTSENRILFRAHVPGVYVTCFSNKMSSVAVKTIAFVSQVSGDEEVKPGDTGALSKGRHRLKGVDAMEASLVRVLEGVREIRNEQAILATRERNNRDTVESTNTRVMWWSLGEIGLLVLMTMMQLMSLKSCFNTRRAV